MFVPFLSKPSAERRSLWRRKGGGKSGGGRGGGRPGGGGGGGGGGTSVGGGGGRTVRPISSPGGSRRVSSFSPGGGSPVAITSGPYAGRQLGGGTRSSIYGSKTYGSGYPGGVGGRGTAGLGFPFIFWPLSFGALGFAGSYAYLNGNNEYGRPDDGTRPGGPQTVAIIRSANAGSNTTLRLLADEDSVQTMKPILAERCGAFMQNKDNIASTRYNGSTVTPPRPEQVVQYYRASTAALSLDSYNNTAIFGKEGTPDVPLPAGIDIILLDCLNKTIGEAIPLEEIVTQSTNDIPQTSNFNAGTSLSRAPLSIVIIVGMLFAFV